MEPYRNYGRGQCRSNSCDTSCRSQNNQCNQTNQCSQANPYNQANQCNAGNTSPANQCNKSKPCISADLAAAMRMPLGMAFVHMQEWEDLYNPDDALCNGTAFPGLNLIFCGVRGKM